MKQWQCSVCGYIHHGDEPPEKCPVCGADRSKFVEIVPKQEPQQIETKPPVSSNKTAVVKAYKMVTDIMTKQHAHPISVHIPNGVLPMSVIFVILGAIFQFSNLQLAAFYNMVFVLISMPFVLFSGYVDWQNRYNGHLTSTFIAKMICGGLVTLIAFVVVIWQAIDPNVAGPESSSRAGFIFLHILMLAAAGTAGFLGGKLVFKD